MKNKPVIKVWCLPKQTESQLKKLFKSIVSVVGSVPKLGPKDQDEIVVLFPVDAMKFGLGTEIVVEASGFGKKSLPRKQLKKELKTTLKKKYPKAAVQCQVAK